MKFLKMHGLGNDFIITQYENTAGKLSTATIQKLGDRNYGIGFDQLLDIEVLSDNVFKIRIFNSDGSEAFNVEMAYAALQNIYSDQPAITLL